MVDSAPGQEGPFFAQHQLGRQQSRWERRRLASIARRRGPRESIAAAKARASQASGADGPNHGDKAPKVLFEALEPRFLLSADLMPFAVDMTAAGSDLTLTFEEATETLRLLDNANSGAVVAEQALAKTEKVVVTGTEGDDSLIVDFSADFHIPLGIVFDAGAGADRLTIQGGGFSSIAYMADAERGLLTLDDGERSSTVSLSGVESVTDSHVAGERAVSLSDADDFQLSGADDGLWAALESLSHSFGFATGFGDIDIDVGHAFLGIDGTLQAESLRLQADKIASHGVLRAQGGEIELKAAGALGVGGMLDVSNLHGLGGDVRLAGADVQIAGDARIDARGQGGGGDVRIGGDMRGEGALPTAQRTIVERGAVIDASALEVGDGGSVVLWADGHTGFGGEILARGGATGGDGGFAEVSGRETLAFLGGVDLSAPFGAAGTLLLDPQDVVIVDGGGAADDGALDDDAILQADGGAAATFTISRAKLESLAATADVVIEATRHITLESLGGGTLSLAATTGSVTFTADADGDGVGTFSFNAADTIATAGGNLTISAAQLTLGNFDVGDGALTLASTGASQAVQLRNVAAGDLNLSTNDGNITQAAGTSVQASGTATLAAGTGNVTLANAANDFHLLVVASANDVTLRDANEITLGALSFTGTFSLTAGKVIVERDADMTLSDAALVVGATTVGLTGVTEADLKSGGGAGVGNTLNASAFGGNVVLRSGLGDDTLQGGSGNTTYLFEGNWGQDEVVAGTGHDLLDFTGHSGTLRANAGLTQITSGTNTLVQTTPVEEIDLVLTPALQTALSLGLAGLLGFSNRLKDDIQVLQNQLPLLSRLTGGGSLGDLSGLVEVFEDFEDRVNDLVPSAPRASDLVAALKALDVPGFDMSVGTERSLAFQGWGTAPADDAIDVLLPVTVEAERSAEFPFDLGSEGEFIGIEIGGQLDVAARLEAALTLGLTTGGTPSLFLVAGDALTLEVEAELNATGGIEIDIGFLKGGISADDLGDVAFAGSVVVELKDPNTDGRITLQELADTPIGDLVTVDADSDASLNIEVDVDLTLGGDGSNLRLPGAAQDLNLAVLTLSLPAGTGIFGDENGAALPQIGLTDGGLADLLNFANVSPGEVIGMLGQVIDLFTAMSKSAILDTDVPFTDRTLGEILGFATAFKSEVLDPLFVSGDALRPDNNGDGVVDLAFGSVQELMGELAANLGLDFTAVYDPGSNEVAFSLGFGAILGFGRATVQTQQQGGGPSAVNEVQRLSINATGGTYRLSFPGAGGSPEFTAEIAHDATATQVRSALEAIPGIGNGNVQVSGGAGGPYTITFAGALAGANVTELKAHSTNLLGGAFPLDFGASLGDIASIETTGALSMEADLNGGFTFRIDLSPSQTIAVNPSVFSPGPKVDVRTTTPGSASTSEVQTVAIRNATGGTFTLSFDGSDPVAVAHNATAAAVQTALEGLSTIGAGNVAVTGSAGAYTVTFQNDLANRNVAELDVSASGLIGARHDGVLTGNANFSLDLVNQPVMVASTVTQGSDVLQEVQRIAVMNATGGTFALTFDGETTDDLDFNASAAVVKAALEALTGIDEVAVEREAAGPYAVYTITFAEAGNRAQIRVDAGNLVNTADFGGIDVTVAPDGTNESLGDLADDVRKAINLELAEDRLLTLGFIDTATGRLTTGSLGQGDSALAAFAPLQRMTGDIAFTLLIEVDGAERQVNGRLRAVDVLDTSGDGMLSAAELNASVTTANLVSGLQNALDRALTGAGLGGFSVSVSSTGGNLELTLDGTPGAGDTLELTFRSPVRVDAGGGRLSLSMEPVRVSTLDLEPGTTLERRVQVMPTGNASLYDDPAFQELGLLTAPTRFDGRIFDDIAFTLAVNGTEYDVTLAAATTSGNTNLDQLVAQLNAAIDSALGADADLVSAVRIDSEGNRIAIQGNDGVERLAIFAPDTAGNGAVTELGLAPGQGPTLRAKATGFTLEDVGLDGSFKLIAQDLSLTATLGFLGIKATGGGTLDANGKFFDASFNLDLRNPEDGTNVVPISILTEALGGGRFLFDIDEIGRDPATDRLRTGIVDGEIAAALGFELDVGPDGAIAGLPDVFDASLKVEASAPNLLLGFPDFDIDFEGPDVEAILDLFRNLSFGDIVNGLRILIGVLEQFAEFDVMSQRLPLIERSVAEMLDVVDHFAAKVDEFSSNPTGALQELNNLLATALGLPVPDLSALVDVAGGGGQNAVQTLRLANANSGAYTLSFLGQATDAIAHDATAAEVQAALEALDGIGDGNVSVVAGDPGEFVVTFVNGLADTAVARIEADLGSLVSQHLLSFVPDAKELRFDLEFALGALLTRPFNLDLADAGLPDFVTDLVGVSASGNLSVDASVDFFLGFGLDLLERELFLATGAAGTRLTAGASASGQNLDFEARVGPFGLFVEDGFATLGADLDIRFDDGGNGGRFTLVSFADGMPAFADLSGLLDLFEFTATGGGEVSLPLLVGTEDFKHPIGTLGAAINLVPLFDPSDTSEIFDFTVPTDIFSFFDNLELPGILALLADPSVVVSGLDRSLVFLQEALNGQIMGVELPFVGDLLADNPAANFIEDFRGDFLTPLANTLRQNNVNLDGLVDFVQNTIFDVFGPGGAIGAEGLLKDKTGDGEITVHDVVYTGATLATLFGDPSNELNQFAQFDFELGRSFTFQADEIAFDLGIDVLGISAAFTPTVTIDFGLKLGFGVHEEIGFYFVAPRDGNEITIDVTVDFGTDDGYAVDGSNAATHDRAEVEGRLLFLALQILDGVDLDGDGIIERQTDDGLREITQLFLSGFVDIVAPGEEGTVKEGRLTVPDLIGGSLGEIFRPELEGGAVLRAQAEVDFSTISPEVGSFLPSISTDILIDFGFNITPEDGFQVAAPDVVFGNVTLDVGSFISDFAGPLLRDFAEILGPAEPLLGPDGFLNMRIPLLSDLAGKTITGKDLIQIFDPDNGPTVVAVLDFIEELFFLIDLIRSAEADGGNLALNFGTLVLTGHTDQARLEENFGTGFIDFGSIIDLQFGDLRSASELQAPDFSNITLPDADFSSPPPSSTQRFTSGVTQPGAINFHILEPETIFKLILGQPDVTLFTASLPTFGFDFFFRQEIPIVGPLVGFFGGGVSGSVVTTIGLDTRGLEQFMASENPAHLLNSFFVDGAGDPFLTLNASIAVGAGVSLGPAKFGAEGGIDATIFFEWADLDGDDKIRLNEMAANLAANSFNPLAVFDISGRLEFFLRAFIEINLLFFKLSESFEFVRLTLFEFNVPFDRPPVLASQSGDTLTLNIGPSAEGRLQGDTRDIGEEIFVKSIGDNTVAVWSPQFGVSESMATGPLGGFFQFSNVSTIIADGGNGNDLIDLSGVTHAGINAVVRGGAGNDRIIGTANDDELHGVAGNNTIRGTGGNNRIFGGPGQDAIFAGSGDDEIFSGPGNDTINLSAGGSNTVVAGPGDNTIIGGPGDDVYDLAGFGSVMTIAASGTDDRIDLSAEPHNFTYFLDGDTIFIGSNATASLDVESLANGFDRAVHFDPVFSNRLIVTNAGSISEILGGTGRDVFHVFETAGDIRLDGGVAEDKYVFWHGFGTITAHVDDSSNPWDSGDVIEVIGTSGNDTFVVTDTSVTFDGSVVTYAAPPPNANILQIKVRAGAGDDDITVASTAATVPVRIDVGGGDDMVTVGNGLVDSIRGTALPGLNGPFGLGPLVLVGSGGFDTLIIDDSADTADTADNDGNITAFLESRVGFDGPVEVGVVSGLGMKLDVFGVEREGRVEFERFEVVDVRLGSGDDFFTVGGERGFITGTEIDVTTVQDGGSGQNEVQEIVITNPEERAFLLRFGSASTDALLHNASAAEIQAALADLTGIGAGNVQVTRSVSGDEITLTVTFIGALADTNVSELRAFDLGVFPPVRHDGMLQAARLVTGDADASVGQAFVHTISGMTIVSAGGGDDEINVIATNEITSAIQLADFSATSLATVASGSVEVETTQQGIRGVQEEVVELTIGAGIGYFTLQFADPDDTETVPGAEQTVPLPFDVTASQLRQAIEAMRLVGVGFVEVTGSDGDFTITFDNRLGDLPDLFAVDLPLYIDTGDGANVVNIQSIDSQTFVQGGAGNDRLHVNVGLTPMGRVADLTVIDRMPGVQPAQVAPGGRFGGVNDLLTLDGAGGGDRYLIYMFGDEAESLINVFDSGAADDGIDVLDIVGTPDADLFLMRAAVAADGLAFVSMLKPAIIAGPGEEPLEHAVERINYDTRLEAINVFGLDGDNHFMVDDTRAAISIYGGDGNDFFQIGQLYKSQRTPATGVPNADVFATLETTRGFLSNGISFPMTIFGGAGDDEFVVYHNLAVLMLFGEEGDDFFMIRSFALIGSSDNLRERTDVSTGSGANTVMYAVNAPVKIDGGTGFNTLIVIGTEFGDDFVVTESGIFGAGINVEYTNIQAIEIDGAEGDDRFFILGSAPGTVTRITGGLGSDTFFVNGETPPVISNDLLGHSGLISHLVDSVVLDIYGDPIQGSYAGAKVEGISANVADDDEPAIRIVEKGGASVISQAGGDIAEYWVVLTRKPENDAEVVVTAIAPQGIRFLDPSAPKDLGLSSTQGWQLTFDADNWDTPQKVMFTADEQGSAAVGIQRTSNTGQTEVQLLAINATKGSFSLGFDGATTAPIAFDRSDEASLDQVRADIEAALNALFAAHPDVEGVAVSRTGTTFTIEFDGTEFVELAALDVNFEIANKGAANEFGLFTFDIEGSASTFVTHQVSVQGGPGGQGDSMSGLFVRDAVPAGERTLFVNGGLPSFVLDQGDDALRGATVKVVSGTGIGQVRMVIANSGDMLTVSEGWFTALDETSRIEILRYAGVSLPSVAVTIVGDDAPALDVRETNGGTFAVEDAALHGFVDGETITQLGLVDSFTVSLAMAPTGTVTVALDGIERFQDPESGAEQALEQVYFVVENADGEFVRVSELEFTTDNWNEAQTVYVIGVDDLLVEGLHKQPVTITASGANYTGVQSSLIVDIWDNDVPMALVLESDGSTDVIERGNGNFDGVGDTFGAPDSIDGTSLAIDEYQVVLSKAPEPGEIVTITVVADPTRTERGGGELGIRAAAPQVELSVDGGVTWGFSQELTFTSTDWFDPRTVLVRAAADDRVDGGDSKSFATQFDLASKIQGPLIITGGPSEDRSADLEREPAMLPGETNFKPSVGEVVDATSSTVTIDLDEVVAGVTTTTTSVQGGSAGAAIVVENTKGNLAAGVGEIQVLSVNALTGSFKLAFQGDETAAITFSPDDPEQVAQDIEDALRDLAGLGGVTVEGSGSTFFIHLPAPLGDVPLLEVVENELRRVAAYVEQVADGQGADDTEIQHLVIRGANGGTFRLSDGTSFTGAIAFDRNDTTATAAAIEAALPGLLGLDASATVTVSASGTTFIIRIEGVAGTDFHDLEVDFDGLAIDEVQIVRIAASSGDFALRFQNDNVAGGATLTTAPIAFPDLTGGSEAALDAFAASVEAALTSLHADLDDIRVVARDGGVFGVFLDITYLGASLSDTNLGQIEVVDSTLERTVREAIEAKFGITLADEADYEQLVDLTVEVTQGPGKNKQRVVTGVELVQSGADQSLVVLELDRPWEGGFLVDAVPLGPDNAFGRPASEFTLERTNPNLLVDENEETDVLILNDTDNVMSYRNVVTVDGEEQVVYLPAAALTVTADRLIGLGMSAGQAQVMIGSTLVNGGISYFGLDEIHINLGRGDNLITIEDTHEGATTINAGGGDDRFVVHGISGHTYLHGGVGADEFLVTDAGLVDKIGGLLTITGDVPQVTATHLVRGSAAQGAFLAKGADRADLMINATGGTFALRYDGQTTSAIAVGASAAEIEARLVADTGIEAGQVVVERIANDIYRIVFEGDLAGAGAEALLRVDDGALTGAFIDPVDAVQRFVVEATGGTFQLGFTNPATGSLQFTDDLPFDIDALALRQKLESLDGIAEGDVDVARFGGAYRVTFTNGLGSKPIELLVFNDRNLTGEGPIDVLTIDDSANNLDTTLLLTGSSITGLGMPAVNEIQTLRLNATEGSFRLSLTDAEVTELRQGREGVAAVQRLSLLAESGSFALTFAGQTTDAIAFQVDGPSVADAIKAALDGLLLNGEAIEVAVEALGDFDFLINFLSPAETNVPVLSVDGSGLINETGDLAHDIEAAELQAALAGLSGIGAGNVRVDGNDDVYVIRFQGTLANTDLPELEVTGSTLLRTVELPGGATAVETDGLIEMATRQDGVTAVALNEIQRLVVEATGGTFTLAFEDVANATAQLAHDLTSGQLQIAIEALAGINAGDVRVTQVASGVFDVEFIRGLSSKNLDALIVDITGLSGGAAIETLQDGGDTGVNQVQVLTVQATGGTFSLTLEVPGLAGPFTTGDIAFDAGADTVRRALQHALAAALTGAEDVTRVPEAFKSDFTVTRIGDTFLIGFQGKARTVDGGSGVSFLVVNEENLEGSTSVVTRMDGINYYGIEQLNIITGSGDNVVNIQGTSSGSYKLDFDSIHAATNIQLGSGNDQVFVSSDADLDHNTIFGTGSTPDVFEFLTGNLDDIKGNLNIDFGEGRHRLLISDEGQTEDKSVSISDTIELPPTGETGSNGVSRLDAAEIQIRGLAKGDITYGADAAIDNNGPRGNFFDGIVYWLGSGDNVVEIDGTHGRFADGQEIERTTTILNTGLGNDHVTVDLQAGEDGFFVLNLSGGRASADPSAYVDGNGDLVGHTDNDTVRAASSTLPLIIFGGFGNNDIIAGQGDDVVFGNFGRVQYVDPASITGDPAAYDRAAAEGEDLIAVFGFGGRGDMISSEIVDPRWIVSRHITLGGTTIIEGREGDDILVGGARGDFIDGGIGRDLIFGDAVELFRRDVATDAIPLAAIADPRFQALLGQIIYSRNDLPAALQAVGGTANPLFDYPEDQFDVGKVLVDREARVLRYMGDPIGDLGLLPDWAEYRVVELFHDFAREAANDGSFGDDYIAGGPGENMIFGQLGDDIIQGNGSIASAVGENDLNRLVNFSAALDLSAPLPAAGHRFQTLDGLSVEIDVATAIDGTSNTVVLTEHGFAEGQRIAYWNDGTGSDIGGLGSGGLYAVHVLDANTIQLSAPVGAARIVQPDNPIELTPGQFADRYLLAITASFEAVSDADSYIEGGGGGDVIFGNLGQNDIVGGSSSLYSLEDREQRPDGTNLIFGGAGTRIDRNHFVTADNNQIDGSTVIALDEVHARNASTIAGNNANIFRLVGTEGTDAGSFLRFNYDNPAVPGYSESLWIIPRAVELLDYTPGGPDFDPEGAAGDIGPDKDAPRGNEIHGESGDDYIYGMAGNAVIFGGAGDDRIVGGWGSDWISGGTGNDGIIGDDGRIFTARYTATGGSIDPSNPAHYAELLHGILMVDQLNKTISAPGPALQALVNPADNVGTPGNPLIVGRLYHTVDLTPFNLDPNRASQDLEFAPQYANDIIYAGLGNGFVHGGAGDDAMLGSEALQEFYDAPINPGNVLRFGEEVAIEFPDYDDENPRRRIDPFLLNFETLPEILELLTGMGILTDAGGEKILPHDLAPYLVYEMGLPPNANGDGVIALDAAGLPVQDVRIAETAMFGGLGNDWMVGGPDNNVLFGGHGSDILDVDNDKNSNGGENDVEDPPNINIQDIAFGGGGRDILIANSSGDRLIDWLGEYNRYLVPFAPYGQATVIRSPSPHNMQFLYDLSAALGADPTRAADMGSDPARNGEPYGEIGLVSQRDSGLWQQQSGGPAIGPQPGNNPGGQRLTLRGVDSGTGTDTGGAAGGGDFSGTDTSGGDTGSGNGNGAGNGNGNGAGKGKGNGNSNGTSTFTVLVFDENTEELMAADEARALQNLGESQIVLGLDDYEDEPLELAPPPLPGNGKGNGHANGNGNGNSNGKAPQGLPPGRQLVNWG